MTNKTFYLNSSFDTKSFSKGSKSLKIAGYANTTSKDRSGDIVTAEAWAKGVENFRKNPIMLYQHKHDCPIGKFDSITVDKKGIYVEGSVSEAAERTHGVQTLIRDGALKSFSVGFRVKDGKYNHNDDSMLITEVELLEISVVSVPCNQESLFSLRKSFSSESDYDDFVQNFEVASDVEVKMMRGIKAGFTDTVDGHYHTVEVDKDGNGVTTYTSHMENHSHNIYNGVLAEADGHTHEVIMLGVPTEHPEMEDNMSERPLSPSEREAVGKNNKTNKVEEVKADATKEVKSESIEEVKSESIEEVKSESIEEVKSEVIEEVKAEVIEEVKAEVIEEVKAEVIEVAKTVIEDDESDEELIVRDPNESIPFISLLSVELDDVKIDDLVVYKEKNYRVIDVPSAQSPIFKFLEVDVSGKPCDNTVNVNADEISHVKNSKKIMSEETVSKNSDALHKDSTKETNQMAEQVVETFDLSSRKSEPVDTKKSATASVSEPLVASLIEKTGEAIINKSDSEDLRGSSTARENDQVKEYMAQIAKYKDEIKALQNSKMLYAENSRSTSQFSEKDMANAVLLAKIFNKRDIFDTKFGERMKAVTTVDQFLSNFSSNIYTEMEQQLVIAPMFTRMAVDAKTFRVPVADEDTDGDVAMFKSGTFATGIADATNVPVSNQNSISSVEFTPHKFMATTHLAKDEEEDTILPILDFLRAGTTRRLARAIDKSILRGTGALTGFTASPTNAIAGAGVGYASVIKGITALANTATLKVSTGSATDKADPSDIAAARTAMGKYGLQLGNDLVYVTSIEGYNNLVTTADFRTVDKFGPNATYLTGSVGAVYGIPIVISEFMDTVGTENNQIGSLLYKPGFMLAERRGIEVESQYEPRQQVTAMYLSTRFDFKALTTNSGAALDTTKYMYAVNVAAGA